MRPQKLSPEQKRFAYFQYVYNKIPQGAIAEGLSVSQPTVSKAIREVRLLEEARNQEPTLWESSVAYANTVMEKSRVKPIFRALFGGGA